MQLISLNGDGGIFSNDKLNKISLPSNLFILQDNQEGISLIDTTSSQATPIHSVSGIFNRAIFVQKEQNTLKILTNNLDQDKTRSLVFIDINV